jgi:uncharacterized delta-60 repeat protein
MRHLHWLTCSLARTFIVWIASTVLLVDGITWSVASASSPDTENCEDEVPSLCDSYGICNFANGLAKDRVPIRQRRSGQIAYPPLPPVLRNTGVAATLQPDGKILVVGTAGYDIFLARYNPDGSLDATFGTDGRTITRITDRDIRLEVQESVSSLILQPDGKVVVAGSTPDKSMNFSEQRFFVARFTTDGHLDQTFGDQGKALPWFGRGGALLGILPDGKLLVVMGSIGKLSLVRLHSNGRLDADFGRDGANPLSFRSVPFLDTFWTKLFALYRPQFVGFRISQQSSEVLGLRYKRHFQYLSYFHFNVKTEDELTIRLSSFPYSESFSPQAIVTQPDGKIIAGGVIPYPGTPNEEYVLARYNANGMVDQRFGTGGKVAFVRQELSEVNAQRGNFSNLPYTCQGLCQVVIQKDGKILAAGSPWRSNFAFVRVSPDGQVDSSFGHAGKVITTLGSQGDALGALALQGDGKIVAVGTCANARHTNVAVLRYNTDGSLDPSFSGDGKVTTRIGVKIYDRSLSSSVFPWAFITEK